MKPARKSNIYVLTLFIAPLTLLLQWAASAQSGDSAQVPQPPPGVSVQLQYLWHRPGDRYSSAFPDAPDKFQALVGEPVLPRDRGVRLAQHYASGEASGSLVGRSYHLWGVAFSPDGRFNKNDSGGYGTGTAATGAGMVAINGTYDDHGASTNVSGNHIAISTSRSKRDTGDRAGSYSIDGYTLTLRYDNGRVQRIPSFFVGKTHKSIWFDGAMLGMEADETKRR